MQFLFPGFLWALAALAVPIIIHLFHFRRFKKVYFTNVHLLKELKEETSSRNKLKNFLVLLSRLLALAALVFAFAQPILKKGQVADTAKKTIALYVDNSFSMQSDRDHVPLITIAKDHATRILDAHKDADNFLILTNELSGKSQRLVDLSTAQQFVEDITITPEAKTISDVAVVAQRVNKRYAAGDDLMLYLISDFQKNIIESTAPIDSTTAIKLISTRAIQENNVALLSAELEAPAAIQGVANNLIVRLQNYGDANQEVQLRMKYADQVRPIGVVTVPADATATDTIPVSLLPQAWHDIELLIDDYPVEFDNTLMVSLPTKAKMEVLNIVDGVSDRVLQSAAQSIDELELRQYTKSAIQYDQFAQQDLIILSDLRDISSGLVGELSKYVKAGGNLLIFPSINANVDSYNRLLQALRIDQLGDLQKREAMMVSSINTDEFVFSGVYETAKRNLKLPQTEARYMIKKSSRSDKDGLMTYRDGASFLTKYNVDRGQVYLCAAPLATEYSSLVKQAEIFVPMIYKMALATALPRPASYTIGDSEIIEIDNATDANSEEWRMTGPAEFIPLVIKNGYRTTVDVRDQIAESGIYELRNGDNVLSHLAFNYDRTESDVEYADLSESAKQIGNNVEIVSDVALADLSQYITQQEKGTPLWRWFLFGALLFLLVESLLLRYWK